MELPKCCQGNPGPDILNSVLRFRYFISFHVPTFLHLADPFRLAFSFRVHVNYTPYHVFATPTGCIPVSVLDYVYMYKNTPVKVHILIKALFRISCFHAQQLLKYVQYISSCSSSGSSIISSGVMLVTFPIPSKEIEHFLTIYWQHSHSFTRSMAEENARKQQEESRDIRHKTRVCVANCQQLPKDAAKAHWEYLVWLGRI